MAKAKKRTIDDIVGVIERKKGHTDNVKAHHAHLSSDNQTDLLNDHFNPAADLAYDSAIAKLEGKNNDDLIGKDEEEIYDILNAYMENFIRSTRPSQLAVFDKELKDLKGRERHEALANIYDQLVGKDAALGGYARSVGRRGGIKVRSLKARLRQRKDASAQGGLSMLNNQSFISRISHLPFGIYARELLPMLVKEGYELDKPDVYYQVPSEQLHELNGKLAGKSLQLAEAQEYGLKRKQARRR
jgi:hypothetical protein